MMDLRQLYLDLVERSVLGWLNEDPAADPWHEPVFDPVQRLHGRDWPKTALSMIGKLRMDQLIKSIEHILAERVPGDFLEAGVWRGGACIMMRAVLAAHGVTDRTVWCADSFAGLPPPDAKYPLDAGDQHHTFTQLSVPLTEVAKNFACYGLFDEQVQFLPGWFRDTLFTSPISRLALLRIDGDMYGSTWEALAALYGKVSPRGIVIVDDYGAVPGCKAAVEDFRDLCEVTAPLVSIDGMGVYWVKP